MSSRTNKECDAINGKNHDYRNAVMVDVTDDLDMMDDTYFDKEGRFDLSKIFPNSNDNTVMYEYTRDHTGRVVSVECHLKVPQKQGQQSTTNTTSDCGNEPQEGQPKRST
jgi:hypothetical protein